MNSCRNGILTRREGRGDVASKSRWQISRVETCQCYIFNRMRAPATESPPTVYAFEKAHGLPVRAVPILPCPNGKARGTRG